MMNPKTFARGMFLALGILMAPVLGAAVGLGVQPALAQEQQHLVSAVLFEGNNGFTDGQLLDMVNTGERGYYTEGSLASDAETIRLAYVNKGYVGVTVTPKVTQAASGRAVITFVVNEGQRTGIAAINFTGNSAFNSGTLKSVIRSHETGWLSWLFRDDSYSEDQLTLDRQMIELYYANHGYPDAQVTSAVGEFDAKRNAYFINFTIAEGDKYRFGNIGVETSVAGLDANNLTDTIRTKEGDRYSYSDLQKTQADMAFEATSQGYAFADVRPRVDRDLANHVFNVTYLIDEGPRVYIERIDITGNTKTRDAVIRRELDFGEGDPFNRSMVDRGKQAIQALGFFKSVDVSVQPGSAPDKVDLSIAVEEQSTGDYGVTAGYSTDSGILGEISVTERNFLGRGQYVRASIGLSQSGQTYDFSFTEPRFMGLNVSAGFDLYHRVNTETTGNIYGVTGTGGQLRFGTQVTRDLSASLFVGIEQKTIQDSLTADDGHGNQTTAAAGESDLFNDGDTFNKVWLGYTLTYNTLDDQKHPHEGMLASLTQQYLNGDWGDNVSGNLLKTEVKGRYFMPIMEEAGVIGSLEGQAGVINALDGGGVSSLETFGYSSSLVRGFMSRGMGARLDSSGEYLGYTAYAAASAEVEFPMPLLPETYGVRGSVWADAAIIDGNGDTNGGDVKSTSIDQNFKSAVGASVIWDSPFGPLRGDFAYVLNKATDDKTQVFQLSLQQLL